MLPKLPLKETVNPTGSQTELRMRDPNTYHHITGLRIRDTTHLTIENKQELFLKRGDIKFKTSSSQNTASSCVMVYRIVLPNHHSCLNQSLKVKQQTN